MSLCIEKRTEQQRESLTHTCQEFEESLHKIDFKIPFACLSVAFNFSRFFKACHLSH